MVSWRSDSCRFGLDHSCVCNDCGVGTISTLIARRLRRDTVPTAVPRVDTDRQPYQHRRSNSPITLIVLKTYYKTFINTDMLTFLLRPKLDFSHVHANRLRIYSVLALQAPYSLYARCSSPNAQRQ